MEPIAEHAFIVLTEPVEGAEDEYNAWYDSEHLDEILEIPGIVAARRYRLSDSALPGYQSEAPARYLAIYWIEGDAQAAFDEIRKRIDSGVIIPSPAVDPSAITTWNYTAIGELRSANP